MQYQFRVSNNEVEYETVIGGLRLVQASKAAQVRIKTDSRLVVSKLTNKCETRDERLKMYKDVTEGLLGELTAYEVHHVPQAKNVEVDILVSCMIISRKYAELRSSKV